MKMASDGIKWASSSLVVAFLLLVFWVWPAWNSGSQTWYWGNDGGGDKGTSEMYRNRHAPSGHDEPFEFGGSFSQSFLADESANQMLAFDDRPWKYHIEWDVSMMEMGMPRLATMGGLGYSLSIGRWSSMTMMWSSYFEAMGRATDTGVIEGEAMTMSMSQMPFAPGDILGVMVMLMNDTGGLITIPLAQTCYITSPTSDPGYPGALPPIPTVSQWGMLLLALVVAFLSFTVIRRRLRTGKS